MPKTHPDEPQGVPFVVDICEFHYGKKLDYASLSIPEDRVYNWPIVYILTNDEYAYVGQTTSVITRMGQHGANEEKKDFTSVSVIFNEEFNASVITDYEHRLIELMGADRRYKLTNKNEGMSKSNYFSKEKYAEMFEGLWEELRTMELVVHTIDQIEESEVFKYSPYKSLTPDQRVALDKISSAINRGVKDADPIVVEGMPGTGKTVLAIYLLKMLKDDPKFANMNIRLMEPVTSLRETLRSSVRTVMGLSEDDIIGPADLAKAKYGYKGGVEKSFDIVLVDETHRLKQRVNLGTQFANYDKVTQALGLAKGGTQLDWILEQVKLPIFFYDPLQAIGPSCVPCESVTTTLDLNHKDVIRLQDQMRVKGGKAYLDFVDSVLSGCQPKPRKFDDYDLVFHEDFNSFVDSFNEIYANHDLSRMLAGYAWKWNSKGDKTGKVFDIEIDGIKLRWNCTYENWVGKGFDDPAIAHEVGCIHSIQGYDLSYAYVIIGNDLVLDETTGELHANKSSYFDRNGFATASEAELNQFIKNIYYVLLTRGIYGTHIYVANRELREFMSKSFY